jgi:hypothetical protein
MIPEHNADQPPELVYAVDELDEDTPKGTDTPPSQPFRPPPRVRYASGGHRQRSPAERPLNPWWLGYR